MKFVSGGGGGFDVFWLKKYSSIEFIGSVGGQELLFFWLAIEVCIVHGFVFLVSFFEYH